MKVVEATTNYGKNEKKILKETRDLFMAQTFIDGLDTTRNLKCVDDLANQFLTSQGIYPKAAIPRTMC